MDYAFLPPEINPRVCVQRSRTDYQLAAAASWDALVAELASAAENYGSVIV